MKKITRENYRKDKYYPRVVRAVAEILSHDDEVAPIEVFRRMSLLTSEQIEDWRAGRVPYLERVIGCNLAKASRILRILRMHAQNLNLGPEIGEYRRGRRQGRFPLRFTKYRDQKLEDAYARHFVVIGKKRRKKPEAPEEGAMNL
jgi:hypothetical protein